MVKITLTAQDIAEARTMAEATYRRFKYVAGYYGNTLPKHFLAKRGEIAVEKWLMSEGVEVDPAFRDIERGSEADLIADDQGIEVKTWRPHTWEEMGRCVHPNQMNAIAAKSAAIVWTVLTRRKANQRP